MSPYVIPVVAILGSFAMTFGIAYMIVTAINRARIAKNQERLAMIEKGADPRLFESIKKGNSNSIIKWGVLLFGVGLGIVVADILVKYENDE